MTQNVSNSTAVNSFQTNIKTMVFGDNQPTPQFLVPGHGFYLVKHIAGMGHMTSVLGE